MDLFLDVFEDDMIFGRHCTSQRHRLNIAFSVHPPQEGNTRKISIPNRHRHHHQLGSTALWLFALCADSPSVITCTASKTTPVKSKRSGAVRSGCSSMLLPILQSQLLLANCVVGSAVPISKLQPLYVPVRYQDDRQLERLQSARRKDCSGIDLGWQCTVDAGWSGTMLPDGSC